MPLLRSSWMISASLVGAFGSLIFVDLAEAHRAEVQRLGLLAVHVVAVCLGKLLDLALQALGGLDEDAAAASASAFASSILFCIAASKFSTVR